MNSKSFAGLLAIAAVGCLIGCSDSPRKSPDVTDSVRKSLDQSNLHDVKVSQDRDKGVVTLTGQVTSDSAKSQAESIAKSIAGSQVVADEIAVVPPGPGASDAKTINSDLDKGIEQNLDAALVQNRFKKDVKYDVKNGVVTLTGEVNSQSKRAQVEKLAAGVPNVQQVVNELQVKDQKASSTQ
ncbi:MAG TPA: BON domain-containing protein [Candidatus Acidoferrales bacterium]|jgi:hyperosmotically inducible periplasmic protein|nr:BON domain-containing protein [Candidatus Acidoferrales bacterium]